MEKKVYGMRSISSRRGFCEGKSTCVVPGERGMNSANILSNAFSQLLRVVLAGRGVGTHREKYVCIGSEVPGSYSGTRERKAPPARSLMAGQPRAQGRGLHPRSWHVLTEVKQATRIYGHFFLSTSQRSNTQAHLSKRALAWKPRLYSKLLPFPRSLTSQWTALSRLQKNMENKKALTTDMMPHV